jgi:hypothetical protein
MISYLLCEIILFPEESVNMPVEVFCFQTQSKAEGLIETDPMNICNWGKARHGV